MKKCLPSVPFMYSGGRRGLGSNVFSCFGCLKNPMHWVDQNEFFSDRDLCQTFDHYSSGGIMSPAQFCSFLCKVQREPNVSENEAVTIMANYGEPRNFTIHEWMRYLFDPLRNYAIRKEIHDNMDLPLSRYFIFTGHNSYLSGNQIVGHSKVKAIANSLRKGVRVVELDLWPSCRGDIHVKHGNTFVCPVDFDECLRTIKNHAFLVSRYPVVVTLEDHLTPSLQGKAAKMIMEILGDYLYWPKPSEVLTQYPSPEDLKFKILISTKPQSAAHHPEKHQRSRSSAVSWSSDEEDPNDSSEMYEEENDETCYEKIISIHGVKTKGQSLVDALRVDENVKRVSISEPAFNKIVESHPSEVIRFTQHNLLRIYPRGMRIDSSNYNPMKAWSYGAQMVAINMQGYGKYLWVTQGFFRANGSCGYVKKPNFLIHRDVETNLETISKMLPVKSVLKAKMLPVKSVLEIKICMGCGWRQQLGRYKFDIFSAPDFYARVGIAGVKADSIMKKTHVVNDKWEPIWNANFTFEIRVPELAVLRIEVHESDKSTPNQFAGQICFPINELKAGYRVAVLCNKKGDEWKHVKILLWIDLSKSIEANRNEKAETLSA